MKGRIGLGALKQAPDRETILRLQGVPPGHQVSERVDTLVEEARELYEALSRPVGIIADISADEFLAVYEGDGRNSVPSPLPGIIANAGHLALFAATLGEPLGRKIDELFRDNDAALGCVLDGIASQRADSAADLLGQAFRESLPESDESDSVPAVLPYSPGYCGWHLTGQRKLFEFLDPGLIDIELSSSCLMSPIKSVSGVLVAGLPATHAFSNDFEFCLDCTTWDCRERIASTARRP
jgi:hypothetical protein